MLSRSRRLLFCCALLSFPAELRAQWVQIDLAPYANTRMQNYQPGAQAYPEGRVVLGGVPFDIQRVGENNAWNAAFAAGPQPKVLDIAVRVSAVAEVHTLINTFYGSPGPASYAWLEFFGSSGAYHRKDLIGNVDIRDHHGAWWTNAINGTTTVNVFTTGRSPEDRLDKQRIVLPSAFHSQSLDRVRLTSVGGGTISDASIQGLSLLRRVGQVNSSCATLIVNGVGSAGSGPFEVSIPAGGDLDLTWAGSPYEGLVLLGAAALLPGQQLGGALVLDLDPSSLGVLFGSTSPLWGALFRMDAQGSAAQRFRIPAQSHGVTLYVQGVVLDSQQLCSGGHGLMTTTSFAIAL
jgi:hypothetical protein